MTQATLNNDRRILPPRRRSDGFELRHGNHTSHVSLGYFPDGTVGEVFIGAAMEMGARKKAGSELEGLWRALGILFSIALQYGAPLDVIAHALTREESNQPTTIAGAIGDLLTQRGHT